MVNTVEESKNCSSRRSFLGKGLVVGGAGTIATGLLANGLPAAFAHGESSSLRKGDVAILRFLSALEIIESDLWQQYNELGGIKDSEIPPGPVGPVSVPYMTALQNLDADMPQYIHDNTEDEFTHFRFINAYLESKDADPVNLDKFRTLPSSKATGAQQIGRLTNLMQLTVDTSWWTRYRSRTENPDLDPDFTFPQAVPALHEGEHPAIPRSDDDLTPPKHIQAIANTAAFHFGFIEQGGTSLYPALAQRVFGVEVLRILLSIGPTEALHFQVWHDKAGAAVSTPLAPLTDPENPELVFPDLNTPPFPSPFGKEDFQTNLIMPEPVPFLSRKFPVCSIVRPTETKGAAMGALKAFTDDGLFIGQSEEFFEVLRKLAQEADAAERG